MKTISIGYSKIKLGLSMFVLGYLTVAPLLIFAVAPEMLKVEGQLGLDMVLVYATLIGGAMLGLFFLVLKIKKYSSSKEAVLIYQDGIWSNVSGLGEKFVPWSQVERAEVQRTGNGFSLVKIKQKESAEQHAQRSSLSKFLQPTLTMVISPITLQKQPDNLADIINDYALAYQADQLNSTTASPTIQPLEEYVKKAA